jgi:type II secretory pathway pseudopilin PulG
MKTRNHKQAGATMMEVLVAMSISLVVTASMIALMSNSLGSTTRIIQMTKLSDDMRVALQMMSRDVRRSNYNVDSMFCYANDDCATDGSITAIGDISIPSSQCFWFLTDRNQDDYEDTAAVAAGGFRHVTVGDVGAIEMWIGGAAPDCTDSPGEDGWVQITDPATMDIFAFSVDDDLSYTQVVKDDGINPVVSQRVRKVRMAMEGRLVLDPTIRREMDDVIAVRNDLLLPSS